jgi:hypothetical protein
MDQPARAVYEFGPFRYDAGQRLLFREGELVPLAPKAVETLHALLDRRGRLVDKTELMKLVWPDTVVEDVGLARNISLLRKALGDESDTVTYIETIPKSPGPAAASLRRLRRCPSYTRSAHAGAGGSPPRALWPSLGSYIGSSIRLRDFCAVEPISPAWPWSRSKLWPPIWTRTHSRKA